MEKTAFLFAVCNGSLLLSAVGCCKAKQKGLDKLVERQSNKQKVKGPSMDVLFKTPRISLDAGECNEKWNADTIRTGRIHSSHPSSLSPIARSIENTGLC